MKVLPVIRRIVATAALVGVLTGCVAPALDSGAFRDNAIAALDSAVSDTRTAAMALQNLLVDRIPRPYADTVVTQSEQSIGPVEDSFGSVDPPSTGDLQLRDGRAQLPGLGFVWLAEA